MTSIEETTSLNDVPDDERMPGLGGPIPTAFASLIEAMGGPEPASRNAVKYDARLRVWILFTELRAKQLLAAEALSQSRAAAASADRHAQALTTATRRLVQATVILAAATVVLVIAALVKDR